VRSLPPHLCLPVFAWVRLAKAPESIDRSAAASIFSCTCLTDGVVGIPSIAACVRSFTYVATLFRVRADRGVSPLAQLMVGDGVRGSRVVKAGEEGRIGEDCRTGEVGGVGVRGRRFSCF